MAKARRVRVVAVDVDNRPAVRRATLADRPICRREVQACFEKKGNHVLELQALLIRFVNEILGVAVVIVVALLLSQALKRLINVLRDLKHVSPQIAARLHAVRRWSITLFTILVVLETLGIFRGAWALISTALAALALGFVAAWSVLSNATAAMLILIFRPFRVGDEVEMLDPSNGFPGGGLVLDMNLLYTTLEVLEQTAVPPAPDAAADPTDCDVPASTRASSNTLQPPLIRVPNNLFFQRPLRTRSRHGQDSKEPFFSKPRM